MSQQKTMEITKHLLAHDLEPLIREPIIAAAHRALSNNNGTYPELILTDFVGQPF